MAAAMESRAARQEAQTEAGSEIVANLAAGRVGVLVCKDGIVVATAEAPVEPNTLPPVIVPVSAFRVGVLLGPVEWTWPGSGRRPLRLDAALHSAGGTIGRLQASKDVNAASDIETLGLAFLSPLRTAAGQLHSRLPIERDAIFAELLLVGYEKDYGPEVWSLRYRVEQTLLRGEFYQTTVHRPEFIQLYPPEKGQPRTLVETHYPPGDSSELPLVDLLKNGDSRIAALRRADVGMGRAADLLDKGESRKVLLVDGLELLRATLQAVTPRDRRQMIATIREDRGVEWVLGEQMAGPAYPKDNRAPAAPSLYKQPRPPQ